VPSAWFVLNSVAANTSISNHGELGYWPGALGACVKLGLPHLMLSARFCQSAHTCQPVAVSFAPANGDGAAASNCHSLTRVSVLCRRRVSGSVEAAAATTMMRRRRKRLQRSRTRSLGPIRMTPAAAAAPRTAGRALPSEQHAGQTVHQRCWLRIRQYQLTNAISAAPCLPA
jgi:hypothetical protein